MLLSLSNRSQTLPTAASKDTDFLDPDDCVLQVQLLDAPESQKLFPPDVLKRAKEYLDGTGSGGTGAYTHSQGVELCREHVAQVHTYMLHLFHCKLSGLCVRILSSCKQLLQACTYA